MIYVQVGLYAEGRTDYEFLIPLLERLLQEICTRICPGGHEIPTPIGVDADEPTSRRSERIGAAVLEYVGTCQLFVIHADADGEPARARDERVMPGIVEARRRLIEVQARGRDETYFVACVPVQMIEAWMLADEGPFRKFLGRDVSARLPKDPEGLGDPKRALDALVAEHTRRRPYGLYEAFGNTVGLAALRRLPAFRAFEGELEAAVAAIARVPAPRAGRRG